MDTEKVIDGLKELSGFLFKEYGKAQAEEANLYYDRFLAVDNAIALLKEQEPIPVEICGEIFNTKMGDCPHCGERLNSEVYPRWCGFCGQAVKWNEG